MLSKEDLCMIINYCQENGLSYKEGYKEFGVTQWAFYTAKRKYMAEEKSSTCGEFLQLSAGNELVPSPLKKLSSDGRDRSGRMLKSASSLLNIELKTPSGMLMRVSGEMTGEMLGEVIRNISGHVQS